MIKDSELDQLVENQLNLQVRISYRAHHDFLMRHGLSVCARVLDVGTGNGLFVSRLAVDHSGVQFVGIDKRRYCIDSCSKNIRQNLEFHLVDMFSRTSSFDFSSFDGFLLRYFLLHVDHSKKILEAFREKAKRPSKFWIIDLDFSQIHCAPAHPDFEKLLGLVKEFCAKKSVDSRGGERILPLLEELGYQGLKVEHSPFSTGSIAVDDLALYLKQEVQCYSRMIGRSPADTETAAIVRFIDEEVRTRRVEISYGMILISAELL